MNSFNAKRLWILLVFIAFNCNINLIHSHSIPFRIGFEFQVNGLECKWAKQLYSIQKHPIFEIYEPASNRKIWHLEIDGTDLEFVTTPFVNTQKSNIQRCIDLIMKALNSIMTKKQIVLNQSDKVQITFQELQAIIKNTLDDKSGVRLQTTNLFDSIKTQKIDVPNWWRPSFTPQVTIQHPLNKTVQLCTALAPSGMKGIINNVLNAIDKDLWKTHIGGLLFLNYLTIESLAYPVKRAKNALKVNLKSAAEEKLHNFLIQTLISQELTNLSSEDPEDLGFQPIGQVDAKRFLTFLSRRPFSDMLKEIYTMKYMPASINTCSQITDKKSITALAHGYSPLFYKFLKNELKASLDLLPYTPVAEIFCSNINNPQGKNFDLRKLSKKYRVQKLNKLFDTEDDKLDNAQKRLKQSLGTLLEHGIISNNMLHLLTDVEGNILTNCINLEPSELIDSIDLCAKGSTCLRRGFKVRDLHDQIPGQPKSESLVIYKSCTEEPYDLFSPFALLSSDDSMGRMKSFFHSKPLFQFDQKIFGSAIIECRNVMRIDHFNDSQDEVDFSVCIDGLTVNPVKKLQGYLVAPECATEKALRLIDYVQEILDKE